MGTIFAQSSARGIAGVAVYRISGDRSLDVLKFLLSEGEELNIAPNRMYYKQLKSPVTAEIIDNAMVVYFKSPHSFTGEDVVELYCHGSVAIAALLTGNILDMGFVRMAEPGEFARRAFLNGKFDLTSAEGLHDLIQAQTVMQHKLAIKQASGELDDLYNSWRRDLLTIISLLEAYIDFPDEEIPDDVLVTVHDTHHRLKATIEKHLDDNRRGELLRDGIKLTILGPPNVGKSSLANFLMQRDISIISHIAGTTRDIVEGHLDIAGYKIILQDTAGIRKSTTDIIEQEGIKRTLEAAQLADIKIVIFDVTTASNIEIDSFLSKIIDKNTILVLNKIDLLNENSIIDILEPEKYLKISINKMMGLDTVLKAIETIAHDIAGLTECPQITRQRYRNNLKLALDCLNNFDLENDLVLATEDIRMAIRSLSNITGKISVEQILGEIFSNFCIGK